MNMMFCTNCFSITILVASFVSYLLIGGGSVSCIRGDSTIFSGKRQSRVSTSADSAISEIGDDNALLRDATKTLLSLRRSKSLNGEAEPSLSDNRVLEWGESIVQAPRYMLHLYERYRQEGSHQDEMPKSGKGERLAANTVRSILPQIGTNEGRRMYIFNLTSISGSEKMLAAEMHVYKKRQRKKIFVHFYELSSDGKIGRELVRQMPSASRGWQAVDALDFSDKRPRHILRQMDRLEKEPAAKSSEYPKLLLVDFSYETEDARNFDRFRQRINFKHLNSFVSQPFLVVFSNESPNFTVDHIEPRFSDDALRESFVDPETGLEGKYGGEEVDEEEEEEEEGASSIDQDQTSRINRVYDLSHQKPGSVADLFDGFEDKLLPDYDVDTSTSSGIQLPRTRRSIFNNEIPHEPEPDHHHDSEPFTPASSFFNLPRTLHPIIDDWKPPPRSTHNADGIANFGQLFPRSSKKDAQKERKKLDRILPQEEEIEDDDPQLIPYPEGYRRDGDRRSKNSRGRKQKTTRRKKEDKTLPLPNKWKSVIGDGRGGKTNHHQMAGELGLCAKQNLIIDFFDIGWSDWIIAPKSFEANYCAGSCPFPLTQRLQATNHATLQSLVHAIGVYNHVPAPCCIPDAMDSMTLLYVDDSKNVVLKNYPGMTVKTCACR